MPEFDPAAQRRKALRAQIRAKVATLKQIKARPNASPEQRKQVALRRDGIKLQIDQMRRRYHATGSGDSGMIEMNKLESMLSAETAADRWWDGLSDKEKKAYVKAHPRSKYGKGAGAGTQPYQHSPKYHEKMRDYHAGKADRHHNTVMLAAHRLDRARKRKDSTAAKTYKSLLRRHSKLSIAHNIASMAHGSAVKNPAHKAFAMKKTAAANKAEAMSGATKK